MTRCSVCRAELVETAWGRLCGACALSVGMSEERDSIGDYERFQLLGEGAMGEVYLARHIDSDEVVALKLAKLSLLQQPGGYAVFRQQARIESRLRHPNIVPVQGTGQHQGQPFVVMPLMEGGTLAESRNVARYSEPRSRLTLVLTIARAIQFAHERGVLHCDLKPENILFDAAWEPRVSDFGLARSLGTPSFADLVAVQGGTRGWMSPEQVRTESLTTASDVYALGLLLYWLSDPAVRSESGGGFSERAALHPPLRPWSPDLDWALAAVAHRALQEDPGQRYQTAAALVEDLERLLCDRPLRGQPIPIWGRSWYWAQRHPGARNALFLLLPGFALVTMLMAAAQRSELRRSVLDVNAYAASGQAAAVLYQLRDYAEAIERAAADPAVQALTHGPLLVPAARPGEGVGQDPCRSQRALEQPTALERYASRFATMTVLNTDGCARARISEEPAQPEYARSTYNWRDYFASASRDAVRPERITYVRKAYRSSVSQQIKFAVSSPLFSDGKWLGVVSGSMVAASTLDLPRMKRSETSERMTVLIGPFEGETFGPHLSPAGPQEFTLLAHGQLRRGSKVTIDEATAAQLARAFHSASATTRQFELGTALPLQRADYVDPLLGGRWLAAFAPVGATGYVVLVQTRDSVAIRPSNGLARTGLVLACSSALLMTLWGSFYLWRRRRMTGRLAMPAPLGS
ncbi:MAG TPA: protein kinase [Polyangiaceae bacterium]|nr:protein kinase [Polyangiaceae bacterium]